MLLRVLVLEPTVLQAVSAVIELKAHSLFGYIGSYCKEEETKLVRVMIIVVVVLEGMVYIKVIERSWC